MRGSRNLRSALLCYKWSLLVSIVMLQESQNGRFGARSSKFDASLSGPSTITMDDCLCFVNDLFFVVAYWLKSKFAVPAHHVYNADWHFVSYLSDYSDTSLKSPVVCSIWLTYVGLPWYCRLNDSAAGHFYADNPVAYDHVSTKSWSALLLSTYLSVSIMKIMH